MENRIRTLAVDDEPLALKQLATYKKYIVFRTGWRMPKCY